MRTQLQDLLTASDLSESSFGKRLETVGLGVRIGPFDTRIRTDVRRLHKPLYRFYQHYPLLDGDEIFSIHARLQRTRSFPGIHRRMVRFTVDGRQPHADMPGDQALPVLEWGLNLVIALRAHCFLMLHSAVLERNGNALLLPAAPGDGKTTLCAGLSFRGWRTLSDEFGLVRPGTREMIPVPRPMALKNDSIDVIREFAPDAFIGPITPNTRKGTVAHASPSYDSIARQGVAAPATLIVFPRWEPRAKLSLQDISKEHGFMLLVTNAFNYELLGEAAFRTVHDLIMGARCYRLIYSDLSEAVACLEGLCDANG